MGIVWESASMSWCGVIKSGSGSPCGRMEWGLCHSPSSISPMSSGTLSAPSGISVSITRLQVLVLLEESDESDEADVGSEDGVYMHA